MWAFTRRGDVVLEPEDLTPEQFEELRADLVELRRTLRAALAAGEAATETVALDQTAVGRLSRMGAMQVQEMAKASLRNHRRRLVQVDNALRLVEDDEYGQCRACDDPVGFRRLKARPETPLCLRCQGEVERRRGR